MKLCAERLLELSEKYGESFYILDLNKLSSNYDALLSAFRAKYGNSYIAYSYKTNYTPSVCRTINELGGYAEVVSGMEYELAKKIGVKPDKIILNGPVKSRSAVEELLLSGGIINVDSENELKMLEEICIVHPNSKLRIGIRCNFDVFDNKTSRFGIDINSDEFNRVFAYIKASENHVLSGLHCHFSERGIDIWKNKVSGMLNLIQNLNLTDIEYIDFGGGLFGKMSDSLKTQFETQIPEFQEYAEIVAAPFADHYADMDNPPILFIEPGSALSGDIMSFVAKVVSIKSIRNKPIATLSGSMYNINPTLSRRNLPITVIRMNNAQCTKYTDLDFGGYTCIESDYLFRGFTGELDVGDYVVFDNAGSYSVVLKPPFILPNVPIISVDEITGIERILKRGETFDDVFNSYVFD